MLTEKKVLLFVKFLVYFCTLILNFGVPMSKNEYVIEFSPLPVDAGAGSVALSKAKVCFSALSIFLY